MMKGLGQFEAGLMEEPQSLLSCWVLWKQRVEHKGMSFVLSYCPNSTSSMNESYLLVDINELQR